MATTKRSTNELQHRLRHGAQSEIIRRILAERHLYDFVTQAWAQIFPDERFVDGWHIRAMCDHLEAVADDRIKQLLINVPPGTMKSLLLSVFWPAWVWTTRPFKKFMFASYSDYLTMRDSVRCRDLVLSEWYQKRWPLELKDDSNSKGKWDNTRGGWRLATSVGGRGTGEHPDYKCLLEGAKVRTLVSCRPIEAIEVGEIVLTRNTVTNRDEWKPVISATKRQGKPSVKITLVTGQAIRCTEDHRIYTRSGYVEAGRLTVGTEVASESEVLTLRTGDRQSARAHRQSERIVLLPQVPRGINQRGEPPEHQRNVYISVQDLPEAGHAARVRAHQESEVLLGQMSDQSATQDRHQALRQVRSTHDHEAIAAEATPVLLHNLRQLGPPPEDRRPEEWPLPSRERRETLQGGLHQSQEPGKEAGPEPLRSVRSEANRLRQGDGRPPRRLQQGKQQREQPRHAVPFLPREAARRTSQPQPLDYQAVAAIERIPTPEWVYDIGVADNHNFYADGILVHNCFDDPHNVTQAESEVEREAVLHWWDGTMETRGAMKNSASVGIMQRLHALDLSGHLLEKGGWDHICLPMRYEAPERDEKTGQLVPRMKPTSIGWQDPRTTDGELLWPEGFDEAKVKGLEIKLGLYNAAGQLQQRPTPRGGGAFERAWFRVLLAQPTLSRVVRYWDKAGTKGGTGAETAGVAIGEYDDPTAAHPAMRTKYVILHALTCRERASEREKLIKQTAAVDAGQWGHVETWVEQEPGSGGLESAENTVANLAGFDCKIERVTGSKEVRAQPLASQASVGKVSILAGDWNRQFLDEIEQFPLGKLKDLVDGASGAFNKLFTPGGGFSNTEGFRVGQNADVFTPSRLDLWTPEQ